MKYYKLKISWEDAKNKLYRTCYIPHDLYLGELGYLLCILFKTKFEHAFMFTDHENIDYVDDSFDNEEEIIGYKVVKYKKVKAITALKKYPKLQFIYDLGDYYCFDLDLNEEIIVSLLCIGSKIGFSTVVGIIPLSILYCS